MRFRFLRRWWLRCSLALALFIVGAQVYVIREIERQVLEPTNRAQGGLSVRNSSVPPTLDPEGYDRQWIAAHYAIEVNAPPATLHCWRFAPGGDADKSPDTRATILLIPGWGAGSAMHHQYLFRLAMGFREEGCRVFLVDLRAHGCSTGSTCSYGYFDAKDLKQLVAELSQRNQIAGPLVIAGHSYGAMTAIQASAAIPEVRATIALSGPKDLFAVAGTARSLAAASFPRLYLVARPFLSDAAFRYAVSRAAQRHGFEASQSSAIQSITHLQGPVLVAHGENDTSVSVENAHALYAARPDRTELQLFPGADHWSYFNEPDGIARIRSWLKQVLSQSMSPE
jgi:pimeloyl-ACP methyl ester carboxylesterase